MLVSWNWLSRYVDLTLKHDELVDRLSLSGLNHEGTEIVDGDRVIDLEGDQQPRRLFRAPRSGAGDCPFD